MIDNTDEEAKKKAIKVRFELNIDDWHSCASENMWAMTVKIPGVCAAELHNSPFYCKGVSYMDIINVKVSENGFYYAGVISRSGHSTYRVIVDSEDDLFREWWAKLENLGCSYESSDFFGKMIFSIDVPPNVDIDAVYSVLEAGERQSVWIFDEGHVGHPSIDQLKS